MTTRISQGNYMGGVTVNEAWAEDPGDGTGSTNTITKAQIEAGNRFLCVITDETVTVDIGADPDGSEGQYLAVPSYPLLIALNSGHYDMKVAYASIAEA